jgi:hypothetical protein
VISSSHSKLSDALVWLQEALGMGSEGFADLADYKFMQIYERVCVCVCVCVCVHAPTHERMCVYVSVHSSG